MIDHEADATQLNPGDDVAATQRREYDILISEMLLKEEDDVAATQGREDDAEVSQRREDDVEGKAMLPHQSFAGTQLQL